MTLEELIEHFVFYQDTINIFNEEEFVEDVFKNEEIPKEWFEKRVKDWSYGDILCVTI